MSPLAFLRVAWGVSLVIRNKLSLPHFSCKGHHRFPRSCHSERLGLQRTLLPLHWTQRTLPHSVWFLEVRSTKIWGSVPNWVTCLPFVTFDLRGKNNAVCGCASVFHRRFSECSFSFYLELSLGLGPGHECLGLGWEQMWSSQIYAKNLFSPLVTWGFGPGELISPPSFSP